MSVKQLHMLLLASWRLMCFKAKLRPFSIKASPHLAGAHQRDVVAVSVPMSEASPKPAPAAASAGAMSMYYHFFPSKTGSPN